MKYFVKLVRNICLGLFGIYSVNVLFSSINIIVPINLYTIFLSSFLGVFGIISIIIIQLII